MGMQIAGVFQEVTYGNWFEFTNDPLDHSQWAKEQGATHCLITGKHPHDCGKRPAKILKTVAYVMVDEGIWKKWSVRKRQDYV